MFPSGNITSHSCRGGHKLRFAWSYIKIEQVLRSEMRKIIDLDDSVFLGGLSLHLNHLIAERVSAHYWQFGTLPIGIFCQIWSQDSLRHLL